MGAKMDGFLLQYRFEKREHDSSKTQENIMGFELTTEACGVC
jgi:hypothetical protein